jgi:hypothetical protein
MQNLTIYVLFTLFLQKRPLDMEEYSMSEDNKGTQGKKKRKKRKVYCCSKQIEPWLNDITICCMYSHFQVLVSVSGIQAI